MRLIIKTVSGCLLLSLASHSTQTMAQLYKCVGGDNKVSYSQQPCPNKTEQKLLKKEKAVSQSSNAPTGIYRTVYDVVRRFKCNTPKSGMAKFPSRADLITIVRNSVGKSKKLNEKSRALYDELGLKRRKPLPAGRACEYTFNGQSISLGFFGDNAKSKDDLLSFDNMLRQAQQLGYPVSDDSLGGSNEKFSWQENGYNCYLKIKDNSNSLSSMKANCQWH